MDVMVVVVCMIVIVIVIVPMRPLDELPNTIGKLTGCDEPTFR